MFVGSFGEVLFSVSSYRVLTFHGFKREGGAKYATHDVIGQPPKVEYLHREAEKISLEIDLISELGVNPEREMQKIIEMSRSGAVNYLIIGGRVYGGCRWVIEDYSEQVKIIGENGEVRASKVSLKLAEYN